jgi:LPLT family lysophospholipid transporter-like MFS transporter
MDTKSSQDNSLFSRGLLAVLIAQFLSALADNAILIAAIAIVKSQGLANLIPLLQESFVAPFILLAPFVGPVADRFPKGYVMLAGNLLKLAGALAMSFGLNPVIAYGIVGIGAAMYSPAKYGILSQMYGPAKLVRANGMMEGSTIVAILIGVLLGGWLADRSLTLAFQGVAGLYAVATLANLLIPRLPPEIIDVSFRPASLARQFIASLKVMLTNADARFSVLGTSVFWASGATLRLMLFAWVPVALAIDNNQAPANLMGALSLGIVFGSVVAGLWITLENVDRSLVGGLLLGPAVLLMTATDHFASAALVMALIGMCGGIFVVPLNALLQQRGHESIGAGNSLAVQNLAENIAMMLFVGLYGAAASAGVSVSAGVIGFGLLLIASVGALAILRRHDG